jgi:hypothetical protein
MAPMRKPLWLLIVVAAMVSATFVRAAEIPKAIDDKEFWRLITDLSETGGNFALQFMSNEDSAQFVIPQLKESIRKGGVFVGVGSEQNFTYIAAIQPKLAFVVDIRRDNMIEHLMYKVMFEMSADRADLISKLFARKRPAGLSASTPVKALFEAFDAVPPDAAYYDENLKAVIDRLEKTHGFPLTAADKTDVGRMMNAFRMAGANSLKGFGDSTNPPYAQLMAATDQAGKQQSYLATEENFKIVKELEQKNLIVPLVGDFNGDKALKGIGQYLKEHGALLNVFYVSNVERYLFDQADHGKQFYANVASLPLDASSTFVRAVTSDISLRLGIPIPQSTAKWRTFLFNIKDCLQAYNAGKIPTYKELFTASK